jgi:hypothetical protein
MSYQQLIQEIRDLPPVQRKQLLHDIIDLLAPEVPAPANSLKRFRGAAAHLRDPQMDAQEHVHQLRREWDEYH